MQVDFSIFPETGQFITVTDIVLKQNCYYGAVFTKAHFYKL